VRLACNLSVSIGKRAEVAKQCPLRSKASQEQDKRKGGAHRTCQRLVGGRGGRDKFYWGWISVVPLGPVVKRIL